MWPSIARSRVRVFDRQLKHATQCVSTDIFIPLDIQKRITETIKIFHPSRLAPVERFLRSKPCKRFMVSVRKNLRTFEITTPSLKTEYHGR
jgi:hypothetical protein